MRKLLIGGGIAVALVLAFGALGFRAVVWAMGLAGPPALLDVGDEGPGVRWRDDYFTIQALDARTTAIGEPRYAQQVYSYLIEGNERAVLFDAGPGLRDVRAVAESLTDRPITFVPSHFHYDHVGNEISFERVAVVDLPYLRQRAPDCRLPLSFDEHLGVAERIEAPVLEVDEWLAPGSTLELGDRALRVLHTPGHTEESISLLDLDSGQLFSGDFVYPGPLFAFLPNSGLGDYLQGADAVIGAAPDGARVFGAHRTGPPGAPELAMADVEDLRATLVAIRDGRSGGTGLYPVAHRVNDRIELLARPRWLHRWTPRHP